MAVPKQIPSVEPAIPAPEIGIAGTVGEANGSGAPGIVSLLDLVPAAPAPAPAELQPKSKPARQPVRFGGRVAEANLLRKVMPVYPPLAKSTRVQGTVEFTALISKGETLKTCSWSTDIRCWSRRLKRWFCNGNIARPLSMARRSK